jgi:head-tail adaptor
MARAGAFRERVTFQRMASTTDDYGNVTAASWTNITTRNAELTERTGFQDDQQGALQDVAIARMKVRYDSTVKQSQSLIAYPLVVLSGLLNPSQLPHPRATF